MTAAPRRPFGAIILAAGKGTRMKSALHKVLHPVGRRPMLLHLLSALQNLGSEKTVVVTGAGREQVEVAIKNYSVETVLQEPQLGTGHAVGCAREAFRGFSGGILILYGDVPLITPETMERLLAALDGKETALAVLGFQAEDAREYGRLVTNSDGGLDSIVEYRDASAAVRAIKLCNSGVMAVRGPLLFDFLDAVGNDNTKNEYYLTDIVAIARQRGFSARIVEAEEAEVMGVNSRAELACAEATFQARMREEAMREGATLIAPETVFFACDTRLGRDVTIEPHVVFGPGVTIADNVTIRSFSHIEGAHIDAGAEIGPFARLRPGTMLAEKVKIGNFVEIKKAVIAAGAKVSHLSYIGDAAIGAAANIGAGTITCNYDGFFKYRTEIGAGAFIGSNTALVAPVKIGEGAIVGAGSVVTRDVAAGALGLSRSEQHEIPAFAGRFRARRVAEKEEMDGE